MDGSHGGGGQFNHHHQGNHQMKGKGRKGKMGGGGRGGMFRGNGQVGVFLNRVFSTHAKDREGHQSHLLSPWRVDLRAPLPEIASNSRRVCALVGDARVAGENMPWCEGDGIALKMVLRTASTLEKNSVKREFSMLTPTVCFHANILDITGK